MLPRVLEPEVMDTAEEAADYDAMDHAEVNRRFVDDLLADWPLCPVNNSAGDDACVLDVGTGTALIPIEICQRVNLVHVLAIDLAEEMLKLGRSNVAAAGLGDRISLHRVDAKQTGLAPAAYDAVVSNSIVHHIPQPAGVIAEMWRSLRPGGLMFVRDLLRPETDAEVERFVGLYTGGASPRQQQLFRQSLHAALSVGEVAELLSAHDLPRSVVQQTSDRHWTVVAFKPLPSVVRPARSGDAAAIRAIHTLSFPSQAEARLVDHLESAGRLDTSLVAEVEGTIVGHIACSPVWTTTGQRGAGLAPLAVRPAYRRQGLGTQLVRAALDHCRAARCGWIVVLGEPKYYGRFGFRAASEFGLSDEYQGGAAFQALELETGSMPCGAGLVRYGPEFAALAANAGDIATAISAAELLLPGTPDENSTDWRWQAIIRIGEFIISEPDPVWDFIRRWGVHSQEDLRDAIATCLLEHLLEYHFDAYFPAVEALALREPLFADTFLRCWKFGQSEEPANALRFDELVRRIERQRRKT